MAPTTRSRSLAVIPPSPSFDPSTYEPFDNQVSRTIDQILTEEASFESSKDEDWPVYSGGDSSSASNQRTPHHDKDVKESRFFSKPPGPNGTKVKKKSKPVAKRNITVIELDSDSEDAAALPQTNGPEPTEATDEVPDAGNEADNESLIDDRPQNDVGVSMDNESPMDDQPQNGVEVSKDLWNPLSHGLDGVSEPVISDEPAAAEEDAIFASVDLSQRNHLLHYLASHPFMQNMVQPVSRSARRNFVEEMRREATEAGMDVMAVDRLIEYVRKLYLEELGIESQSLPEGLDELPFGEEIYDDHLEVARRRKSRKRSLESGEKSHSKKKNRKKEERRVSKEVPGPSLQSALQQEASARTPAVESSRQDSPKHQDDKEDAVIPAAVDATHGLEAGSHGVDASKTIESSGHMLQPVIEQRPQHEDLAVLDKEHTKGTTIEPNGDHETLKEQPVGEPGWTDQQTINVSSGPGKSIVVESSNLEPDLPPNHAQARRGSKDKGHKKARKEGPLKASKSRRASRSTEVHADENAIASANQPTLPLQPKSISKPVREASITLLDSNHNGLREEQRLDSKESNNANNENGGRSASTDIGQQSPTATTEREKKPDRTDKDPKKHSNWRKKERKKKKKRHSHFEPQDRPPTGKQAPEPHPMSQPPNPVSFPEPTTPRKSSKKSKFSALSPNPDEWDLDF